MAFGSLKKSAWDQIKTAVANAADAASDKAGDVADAAVDAHEAVHSKVKAGVASGWGAVQSRAQTSAEAVRSGASAVGSGISAAGDKVESVANGVVVGAVAGALAAYVMNRFQAADAALKSPGTPQATAAQGQAAQQGGTSRTAQDGGGDNATVQVAQQVSRLAGHDLQPAEKDAAGSAVHYGYGAAMGALYGGLTEILPSVGMGLGVPYATALWLFGDEIATAALGLGKKPTETTPAEHATAFASHLVYGITLDISRRVLRHII